MLTNTNVQMQNNEAKARGFQSPRNYKKLVSKVPMGTEADREAFLRWRINDGTRAGLLKLIGDTP